MVSSTGILMTPLSSLSGASFSGVSFSVGLPEPSSTMGASAAGFSCASGEAGVSETVPHEHMRAASDIIVKNSGFKETALKRKDLVLILL